MNGCGKYEDLIARFVHGEILLQEREDLEGHLAVCASCERLYSEITAMDRLLRGMPEKMVDPPAHLRARIMASLPEEKPARADRRWWGWATACAAAACALLAVWLHRADLPRGPKMSSTAQAPAGSTAPARTVPAPPVAPAPSNPAPPTSVAAAPPVKVIREVKIFFYYPPAQKVAVTGDFNGWDRDGVPLKHAGKPGLWVTNLRLPPGAYSYNFIVDGDVLVPDPNAANQAPDGYGGTNSILLVKGDKSA